MDEPQLNPPIKKIRAPRKDRKGTHYKDGEYVPTDEWHKQVAAEAQKQVAAMTHEDVKALLASMTRHSLTTDLLAEITALISEGVFPVVAARKLNVPLQVFKGWMERGEDLVARELYTSDTDPEGLQAQLYLLVNNRDAAYEIDILRKFHARVEDEKDYRGAAWMLERHWPERWSKRDIPLNAGDSVEKPIINRMKEKARKADEQARIEAERDQKR